MASVMGICGGFVWPKTENVDFSLVLIVGFLKGQEGHEYSKEKLRLSGRSGWEGVGGG